MKTLALNILDIVQNSIRAKADEIGIRIEEFPSRDLLTLTISDNGSGIPQDKVGIVTNPFYTTRTRRKMGLGLSLLKYHSEIAGGAFEIVSKTGAGTEVRAWFSYSHIDRQPLGDIPGVLFILMASEPGINFRYLHHTEKGELIFSVRETMEYLGLESLNEPSLLRDLKEMINENLQAIDASVTRFKVTF